MLLVLVVVVRIAWNSGNQFELKREMIESSMLLINTNVATIEDQHYQ